MNKLGYALAVALTTLSSENAKGQSVLQGVKGPTKLQLDERVTFSSNEQSVDALTNTLILKYWNGDKFGEWAFINVPFKFVGAPNGSNEGLGDVSVGLGPRSRIDNLHLLPYLALTFPTGETTNIPTGNGRHDIKTGVVATYLFRHKTMELTSLLEYNKTGQNQRGINPPNETTAGFLAGAKITPRLRIATGLTDLIRGNGFLLTSRTGARYTISPRLHFEAYGDFGINNVNIPRSNGASFFMRYNF